MARWAPLAPAAADLPEPAILRRIRHGIIGSDTALQGPFGRLRMVYADYTASGRSLDFVEDFIRQAVLPTYGNTHSESSTSGRQTTQLREDARAVVRQAVGGDRDTAIIFTGAGATGAVDSLIGCLNLRLPADLDARYGLSGHIPPAERPVVFIGPYEHHSNELPWRESIADVVVIPETADGHIDTAVLSEELQRYPERPVKIGSFSAASNVTGIITDTDAITALLHRHGALAFWDYAAAGPYLPIRMAPLPDAPATGKDAVFLSPHKFIGGPGTAGVLAVRRQLLTNTVPDVVGGGTVSFVSATEHHYLADAEHREEGGTPAIVESIRTGLVFALKQEVGTDVIAAHESDFARRAISAWQQHPRIEVLGNLDADRLSIVSFLIRGSRYPYLHYNAVVAMLNDLFGIQGRGGCSCAGPYGHRLLGIDSRRSRSIDQQVAHGCDGVKPGWVRLNFNYFLGEEEFRYLVDAVWLLAEYGERLLPQYVFDATTGLWRHRDGSAEPLLRLADVGFDADGRLRWPERPPAARSRLDQALDRAAEILRTAAASGPTADAALTYDALRWFELPAESLVAARSRAP